MKPFEYKNVVENIKESRKRLKITQKSIADHLGITPQAYFKYEKMIRKMDIKTISKIAIFLNLPSNYFFLNDIDIKNSDNTEIHTLLEYYDNLIKKVELNNLKIKKINPNMDKGLLKLTTQFMAMEISEIKTKINKWLDEKSKNIDFSHLEVKKVETYKNDKKKFDSSIK